MLTTQFADQLTVLHDNYREALRQRLETVDPRIKKSHIACLKFILENPGCTAHDIATAIFRDKSQVTRTLKELLGYEWISKKVNPNDGRSAFLFLTTDGHEIGEVLSGVCYTVGKQMHKGLDDQLSLDFLKVIDHMLLNLKCTSNQ